MHDFNVETNKIIIALHQSDRTLDDILGVGYARLKDSKILVGRLNHASALPT